MSNVAFYEKIKDLQEIQHQSESKRTELEQELNTAGASDRRILKLKALRLQSYWKKICEDEKKSQWRNEQLLKDIDRVEAHMATLASKTQRLRMMKKQYEDHIEKTYPNWKEKVVYYQKLKEQNENIEWQRAEMKKQQELERLKEMTAQLSKPTTIPSQPVPSYQNVVHQHSDYPSMQQLQNQSDIRQAPSAGSTLQTVSSLPTGFSITSMQQQPGHLSGRGYMSPLHEDVSRSSAHGGPPVRQQSAERLEAKQPQEEVYSYKSGASAAPRDRSGSRHGMSPRKEDRHIEKTEEDISEINSDDDLPMSGRATPQPLKSGSRTSLRSRENSASEGHLADEDSVYVEADIRLDGLYNLMTSIEQDLHAVTNTRQIYRASMPAIAVRKEIVSNANKGAVLTHMDTSSMCMTMIDQLPLLVYSAEGGCLIPDKILFKTPAVLNQDTVKSNIHPACHPFWDRLFEHFIQLMRYKIMKPDEIANVFAQHLIDRESPYESKAQEMLQELLEDVTPEEIGPSPASSSTFSTMPTKAKQPIAMPTSIAENGHEEDQAEFFNQPVPQPATLTQSAAYRSMLGETMSTQKSMVYEDSEDSDIEVAVGSTAPKQTGSTSPPKEKPQPTATTASNMLDEFSSSEDEAEKLLRQGGDKKAPTTVQSPDASRISSPEPVSTGGGYVPSGLGDTGKSGKSTLASSLGSTGGKKKPAFMYGDSDTDEDITLPDGSKNNNNKKSEADDFLDFYN